MDKTAILNAVYTTFDREVEFPAELVHHPSTRGAEQTAQDLIAAALTFLGYGVDRWTIEVADIAGLPGLSPVIGDFENAVNVIGTLRSQSHKGRSLILNGHADVVPAGPLDMWDRPPFGAYVEDDRIYGRGAGDMKAGLASSLFAVEVLRRIGQRPAAGLFFQSVVEEECTGNGALACSAAITPMPPSSPNPSPRRWSARRSASCGFRSN